LWPTSFGGHSVGRPPMLVCGGREGEGNGQPEVGEQEGDVAKPVVSLGARWRRKPPRHLHLTLYCHAT
jgi:hypothetical protein